MSNIPYEARLKLFRRVKAAHDLAFEGKPGARPRYLEGLEWLRIIGLLDEYHMWLKAGGRVE